MQPSKKEPLLIYVNIMMKVIIETKITGIKQFMIELMWMVQLQMIDSIKQTILRIVWC